MSNYCKKEIDILIKFIHIYIADILIEYEKQTGHIPENVRLYNDIIRKSLEGEKFTTWLNSRGVHCNEINDTELLQYMLNLINDNRKNKLNLLVDLSPCDTINTFARYNAELSLVIIDDN